MRKFSNLRMSDIKSQYSTYLNNLGYTDTSGEFNRYFIYKSFIESWTKGGFHNFWRYWNVGINFFTRKLYLFFGGNRNRLLSSFLTFTSVGLIHCIIVYPFLGFSYTIPVTFLCFYLFNEVFYFTGKKFNYNRLGMLVNSLINIGLVLLSFNLGFYVNSVLN